MGFSAGSGPQAPQRTHPASKHLASRLSSIDHEDHEGGQNRLPNEVLPGPSQATRGDETIATSAGRTIKRLEKRTGSNVASGSPVPPRRAFAKSIHGLRSLRAACALALRAALAGKTGSRGTGDPSLERKALCGGRACQRSGEAGIGERLRSDEILRGTTKLLPAPPTNHPPARGPLGWLKRCFWIASAASSTTHSGYSPGTER